MKTVREVSYDLEVYPEYFVCCLGERTFHIGDIVKLRNAMSRTDTMYVSYNGIGYDNMILGFAFWLDIMDKFEGAEGEAPLLCPERLKQLNDLLIEATPPTDYLVREFVKENISTCTVAQKGESRTSSRLERDAMWADDLTFCDLYLVGDKKGGLKKAAIILDCEDLGDCPVDFQRTNLTQEEKDTVDRYCMFDRKKTDLAKEFFKSKIEMRDLLKELHGIEDAHILGAAALAEKCYKAQAIAEYGDQMVRIFREHKVWATKPLPRQKTINLIRCGKLNFKDENLSAFQTMIRECEFDFQGGIEAKEEIEESYATARGDITKTPYVRCGISVPRCALLVKDTRGHEYQFGVGGLHDEALEGMWYEDAEWILRNVDVKSYYPTLIKSWKIGPRHFLQYVKYVANDLAVRLLAKLDPKKKGEAEAGKLKMNSSFGKMKDKFSSLFDPFAHFGVSLTGQMGLLNLIDGIYSVCPSAEIINTNTDGVCVRLRREEEHDFTSVCKSWEKVMRVELEFENYVRWAQLSCNIYCALKDNGKIKSKGTTFKLVPDDLGQAFSLPRAVKHMAIQNLLFDKEFKDSAKELEPKMFLFSGTCGKKTRFVQDGKILEGRSSLRYVIGYRKGSAMGVYNVAEKTTSKVRNGLPMIVADRLADLKMEDIDLLRYVDLAKEVVGKIRKSEERKKVLTTGFFGIF